MGQGGCHQPAQTLQSCEHDGPSGGSPVVLWMAVPGGWERRRQFESPHPDYWRFKYHDTRDKGLYGQCPEDIGGGYDNTSKKCACGSYKMHRLPGLPSRLQGME